MNERPPPTLPRPRRRALLAAAIAIASLPGCVWPDRPSLDRRLGRVEAALGPKTGGPQYLRYAVESEAGSWTREIVSFGPAYAERRTRSEDGASYAFGRDERGAWMRAPGDEVIAVESETWEQEARTGAALFGLGFTRVGRDDEAEYLGRSRIAWEFAYRPAGGRTLTFQVDRVDDTPRGFHVIDDFGRLVSCSHIDWIRASTGPILGALDCESNDRSGRRGGRFLRERFNLEQARSLDPADVPDWARPGAARRAPRPAPRAVELPIQDPRRLYLPVAFGDRPAQSFVVDTGAFFTTLTADAARELGVIPTGEARLHVEPPWLAHTHLWVGVVPRMTVAGVEIHGERVLVAESSRFLRGEGAAGLLGGNVLRRFVLDVDSPAGVLRLASRDAFRPDLDATPIRLRGSEGGHLIDGEVDGVDKGGLILDTGAPDNIVVHAYRMKVVHPRKPGSDALMGGSDALHGPDYHSEIEGLHFGPFPLPAMDAIGRDQNREAIGGGVALVGMGVIRYFRLAFDMKANLLYAWPGDAYVALRRAGIDLEQGPVAGEGRLAVAGLPTVDRVVDGSPADRAGIHRGDVFLGIAPDLRRRPDVESARRALARSAEADLVLWMSRRGIPRPVSITLNPPDCVPANDPVCEAVNAPSEHVPKKKRRRRR